jgi:hypothetical protein
MPRRWKSVEMQIASRRGFLCDRSPRGGLSRRNLVLRHRRVREPIERINVRGNTRDYVIRREFVSGDAYARWSIAPSAA